MSAPLIRFTGNTDTSVVKQGKYRTARGEDGQFTVSVVIETDDGTRSYPSTSAHLELVRMVNGIKSATGVPEGGQFYINEWHQVIVPTAAEKDVFYYAGEYHSEIVLGLNGQDFSGRPHDDDGNLLKPGDAWIGRPRPGMRYTLAAGGADIYYTKKLGPGMEQRVKLSKIVGEAAVRVTARKIALIRGNAGGSFYVNEHLAIFGPGSKADGYAFVFIGILKDSDAWFPKPAIEGVPTEKHESQPELSRVPEATTEAKPDSATLVEQTFKPKERRLEIADGEKGHSFDNLFAVYLAGAKEVTLEDPYMTKQHQAANLLRFCELIVRLGSATKITLITKETSDDTYAKIENIKRSLQANGVAFTMNISPSLHDRRIRTDHGWEINLGRGLDMYKRPEDWASIGVFDFALRPCHQTTIVFHRLGSAALAEAS
jgi:Phospholipase D-like domain at C-terminus of MIT